MTGTEYASLKGSSFKCFNGSTATLVQGTLTRYPPRMLGGFTKWAEAVPVSSFTAKALVRVVMEQWVARYGIPDQIHSDQGWQFTKVFSGYLG